jgi:hypothetical protein
MPISCLLTTIHPIKIPLTIFDDINKITNKNISNLERFWTHSNIGMMQAKPKKPQYHKVVPYVPWQIHLTLVLETFKSPRSYT